QEISFPLSPLLLVPLSSAPYSPLPASSTLSSTTNQNTIDPATRITPHSASAIANEPVKCAMKPVTIGASVAPTLPPKFWMPETVPTIFFELTACVSAHVLGDATPRPLRLMDSNHTAVILSSTKPAGTIRQQISIPMAINILRTLFSSFPRRISQSLSAPE